MSVPGKDGDEYGSDTDETHEIIAEGVASTVSRTWASVDDGDPQLVVVKTATTKKKFSKEPHDILKELRIVSSLRHVNIIEILEDFRDIRESTMNIWMTYIPYSLAQLLASPAFSPHVLPTGGESPSPESLAPERQFELLARSVMIQILFAIAYLHERGIAHRDIKPNNILLTFEGCVKLIDFGIVWKESETAEDKKGDLWPEYPDRMYFEVSTGPYRAPELLFGTRSYNAFAIDMWSLGSTFAEFFTSLKLCDEYEEDEEYPPTAETDNKVPFFIPEGLRIGQPGTKWARDTLFDGMRGEIGLAWSIFKIMGTPTEQTWPTFKELPDASRIDFTIVPSVPLSPLLPNLPSTCTSETPGSSLDLLQSFLVYPPSDRLGASQATQHPWFSEAPAILVPVGYPLDDTVTKVDLDKDKMVYEWEGVSLINFLANAL